MKSIFVFIAPYEEMAVMAEEVARELKLDGWVFDVGYGESGLQLAERYYEQGAKLIGEPEYDGACHLAPSQYSGH